MYQSKDLHEIPISEEFVFRGRLIDVSRLQVRLPDGRTALRELVHHNGGVAIVPVDAEGNVTLVRQHRVAVNAVMLEIPAGKLDSKTEEPLSAAIRELEEETGLRAEKMELLTVMLPTVGYCTERLSLYLATGLSQHSPHLDADEFLHVARMPLADAFAAVMRGEMTDGKTALGILMAAQRLKQPEFDTESTVS